MTKEEILLEIEQQKAIIKECTEAADYYNALQTALKNVMNGSYGAFANKGFALYNNEIANSITAQGRQILKYIARRHEDFWHDQWHEEEELHELLGVKNVKQIVKNGKDTCQVVIYGDTDTNFPDSLLYINRDNIIEKIRIEDFYNSVSSENEKTLITGKMLREVKNISILNWSKTKGLYYVPIVNVVKHKNTKQAWKMKTKSGKEIIVTADHNLVVFRNGEKVNVKPRDVLKTDKVLTIIS